MRFNYPNHYLPSKKTITGALVYWQRVAKYATILVDSSTFFYANGVTISEFEEDNQKVFLVSTLGKFVRVYSWENDDSFLGKRLKRDVDLQLDFLC